MSDHDTSNELNSLIHNKNLQFWSLQTVGWMGISVISFVSLTLWYNQSQLAYITHNLVQSCLGILISWPLRWIFKKIWTDPLPRRLTLIVICVLFFSLIWSVARLVAFLLITDETDLWGDFGGWYYPSIFIFFCWTALYHGIKYYQLLQEEHRLRLELLAKQKHESLLRSEAESQAREALLKMLRYQINPHFLFNTMNSVSALVAANQNDKAQEMILQLSHFLRYSLSEDLDKQVPLQKELEALGKYLQIEKSRFGDRLKTEITLKNGSESCLIPSLILQPLLENSIKYAIAPSEDGGIIRISAEADRDRLSVTVEDTGSSGSLETKSESTGLGLKNIKARLNALFPDNHELLFEQSTLGGAMVKLVLPATRAEGVSL